MVEKNLFLHELAIVAIVKDEAHYLKEWLDYHLAAGVDHFFIYDNDSKDDTREVYANARIQRRRSQIQIHDALYGVR